MSAVANNRLLLALALTLVPLAGCRKPATPPTVPASRPSSQPAVRTPEVYSAWPFDAGEAARRQEETARALGVPGELVLDLEKNVTMKLVLIPAGRFLMGSPEGEPGRKEDEGPQHEVTIRRPFYMGIYEVTQEQYGAIMKWTSIQGQFYDGPSLPMEMISWEEAMDFCDKVSDKTGRKVSLPTEAQWEYACRAGTQTAYNTGETIGPGGGHGSRGRSPLDKLKPNAFGLYQMHEGVGEWCQDRYYENPREAADEPAAKDPAAGGLDRVVRGGLPFLIATFSRSASRLHDAQRFGLHKAGIRVVVAPPGASEEGAPNPVEKARELLAAARVIHRDDGRTMGKTVMELAALGAAAKPEILAAVNDPDSRVHHCALAALSYMPDANDVPVLIDALGRDRTGDDPVWLSPRKHAGLALKMLDRAAVKPLIDALTHKNPDVRCAAAGLLYEIAPKAAADPVLEAGRKDADTAVRYPLLELALEHGDRRALEPLLSAVQADKDEKSDSRRCALMVAFKHGSTAAADLVISAVAADEEVLWDIPSDGPRDARLVPYLIRGLDSKTDGCLPGQCWGLLLAYEDNPQAAAALAAHGWKKEPPPENESVESLLEKVRGRDGNSVWDAARALGKLREKRAVKPLLELIAVHDDATQVFAIKALGEIGDASAVAPLINRLSMNVPGNSNMEPRSHAVSVLGHMRAREAVEPLIAIASDPGSFGPQGAIEALGEIRDERALAALKKIFRTSPDPDLREHAWRALREKRSQVGSE